MMPNSVASGASPYHTIATASGAATTANATRRASSLTAPRASRARSGGDAPEASLASLEREHRLEQLAPPEVGPQHARDVQLRVRDLPQQEVRDPLLAGRADEQVGVGTVGGVEPRRDRVLVDLLRRQAPRRDVLGEQPRRTQDLGAAAVGDEQIQR